MVKRKHVKAYQMKVAEITGEHLDTERMMKADKKKMTDDELMKYIENTVAFGMEMSELEKEALIVFHTGKSFNELEDIENEEFNKLYNEAKEALGVETASSFLSTPVK